MCLSTWEADLGLSDSGYVPHITFFTFSTSSGLSRKLLASAYIVHATPLGANLRICSCHSSLPVSVCTYKQFLFLHFIPRKGLPFCRESQSCIQSIDFPALGAPTKYVYPPELNKPSTIQSTSVFLFAKFVKVSIIILLLLLLVL